MKKVPEAKDLKTKVLKTNLKTKVLETKVLKTIKTTNCMRTGIKDTISELISQAYFKFFL